MPTEPGRRLTLGFMVEGSTGCRALQVFQELPQGTVLETFDLARRLRVKPGALHQLLANPVKLRLIKKIRRKQRVQVGWTLGPGNESVTIERHVPRREPTTDELARRALAAERRAARQAERDAAAPTLPKAPAWPPGFVSTLGGSRAAPTSPELRALSAQQAAEAATLAPAWLRGSRSVPAANSRRAAAPAPPRRYVARWHVRYADEAGQLSGVVQVLKAYPKLQRLDVWCEWRRQVRSLRFDGFSRIDDAETFKPVDLAKWLCRRRDADARSAAPRAETADENSVAAAAATCPPQHASAKVRIPTNAIEPALA